MPPLPLPALLALYASRQVCMRALPAVSLEYFASTALGKTAGPLGAAGSAAGFAAVFAASVFGAAAVAAVGVAAASLPHSALRKSFHFWPLSEPAVLAA